MITTLTSISRYKGFELESPFSFKDYICLVTGKNGSGKTRLLESISNGSIEVKFEENIISTASILTIDMTSSQSIVLQYNQNPDFAKLAARGIFNHIYRDGSLGSIPEICPLHTNHYGGMHSSEEFLCFEIIKRAENLFQKNIEQISIDELEFSIIVHKEIVNGRAHPKSIGISPLTVNYFQAFRKNRELKFLATEGENVRYFDDTEIQNLMGDDSPAVKFNKILHNLFRGKFYISLPSSKNSHLDYQPQLKLKSNDEPIEINNLSSGEKIIFWLAEKTFEMTYSDPINIFSNRSLILIDEPDAHLHPLMTSDLFNCLKELHESLKVRFCINTHSPTTVALCPNEQIINLTHHTQKDIHQADIVDKDSAISQLLDGISQLSINPSNQRQVYVENISDKYIYQRVFSALKNRTDNIDININLEFINSGAKIAESELKKHIAREIDDEQTICMIAGHINSGGNCEQVIGAVESLSAAGNSTVRGLIDWDNKDRKHNEKVSVFAKQYAYSIENVIYDPISIFTFYSVHHLKHESFEDTSLSNKNHKEVIASEQDMQLVYDIVTEKVLKRTNSRNHKIEYMNNITLFGDKEYFIPQKGENGHDFESKVLSNFPEIRKARMSNNPLAFHFLTSVTLGILDWGFIHKVFEQAFIELQK